MQIPFIRGLVQSLCGKINVIMTITFYPPPLNVTAFQAEFNNESFNISNFKNAGGMSRGVFSEGHTLSTLLSLAAPVSICIYVVNKGAWSKFSYLRFYLRTTLDVYTRRTADSTVIKRHGLRPPPLLTS